MYIINSLLCKILEWYVHNTTYVVYEKEHNSLPLSIGFILTLKEPFAKRKDPEGESMRANFKIT